MEVSFNFVLDLLTALSTSSTTTTAYTVVCQYSPVLSSKARKSLQCSNHQPGFLSFFFNHRSALFVWENALLAGGVPKNPLAERRRRRKGEDRGREWERGGLNRRWLVEDAGRSSERRGEGRKTRGGVGWGACRNTYTDGGGREEWEGYGVCVCGRASILSLLLSCTMTDMTAVSRMEEGNSKQVGKDFFFVSSSSTWGIASFLEHMPATARCSE